MKETEHIIKRDNVKKEETWDLSDLFKDFKIGKIALQSFRRKKKSQKPLNKNIKINYQFRHKYYLNALNIEMSLIGNLKTYMCMHHFVAQKTQQTIQQQKL